MSVRVWRETKDEGKGQRRSKDPNNPSNGFHAGIDGFQTIGASSETTVQATTFPPPSRTIPCDSILGKLLNFVGGIHGRGQIGNCR
jgi:hypothetical protein